LGSNPALLGFVMRPHQAVNHHTCQNITETGVYTINNIPENLTERAHYTSAKFEKDVSEFAACVFTEEYVSDFSAPFVAESERKLSIRFTEEIYIEANNIILIIGVLEHISVGDRALNADGSINLQEANFVGISGLDSYYKLNKIAAYPAYVLLFAMAF
jgi:flavin reductase (DIM6/NTAB) family NADH-FMN oxidoreductase RutF